MRWGTVTVAALIAFAGCGGDDDAASTTTERETTTTKPSTTTTEQEAEPLRATAVQYLGLFNAQLPLAAPDANDLRLDEIADGVYGSTVDRGATVMVFADSPTSDVTAVAITVDLDITEGQTPPRLIGAVPFGLTDDPAAIAEAFNDKVVPELDEIDQLVETYELGALDLIQTVEGQAVTWTYVAPGGSLPAYLD